MLFGVVKLARFLLHLGSDQIVPLPFLPIPPNFGLPLVHVIGVETLNNSAATFILETSSFSSTSSRTSRQIGLFTPYSRIIFYI